MKNSSLKNSFADDAAQGAAVRWAGVLDNLSRLALRRSERMVADSDLDPEASDRDARTLRTLMSSAEIAERMRAAQPESRDDGAEKPSIPTDAEIEAAFARVRAIVERELHEGSDADARAAPDTPAPPVRDDGAVDGRECVEELGSERA